MKSTIKADQNRDESPFTVKMISMGARFTDLAWDGETGQLLWTESRAKKNLLYSWHPDAQTKQVINDTQSIRGGIGYGGGGFSAGHGKIFYVEGSSCCLFSQDLKNENGLKKVTKLSPKMNQTAGPEVSLCGKWLLYIHRDEDDREPHAEPHDILRATYWNLIKFVMGRDGWPVK
jgi:sugar lactone lactonase YvrE